MNHQEYVLSLIKDKYKVAKLPVRAILTHWMTQTKQRGIYIEFRMDNIFGSYYKLFINDKVGERLFHNAPGVLCDPKIVDCLWFKEDFDKLEILNGLII